MNITIVVKRFITVPNAQESGIKMHQHENDLNEEIRRRHELSGAGILTKESEEKIAHAIRGFAAAMEMTIDEAARRIFDAIRVMQAAEKKEEFKLLTERLEKTVFIEERQDSNFIKNKINRHKAKWQR